MTTTIELSNDARKKIMLSNIVKMLTNRNLLDVNELDSNINKITTENQDIGIYKIKTNNGNFYIKFSGNRILTINKNSSTMEFILSHDNSNKILVVHSINPKAKISVMETYPQVEIFTEDNFMIDLISYSYVPKHILLSKEEGEKILELYNARKRELPKILSTDPVVRYYNMPNGSICRIIRFSETGGEVPFYRLVTKHNPK